MSVRSSFATSAADLTRWGLRSVLHRNGGVLPGTVAMKIDPELLGTLGRMLDKSVVVTGTNGKTTTTNLIADAVAASGTITVCNRAGNNMEPGIVGALLESHGRIKHQGDTARIGVFECDELYTARVLPKLKPRFFVLLNLFRDQLDRCGEIDHTQDVIVQALESSRFTTLIFNADDPLCAAIADRVPNPAIPFGLTEATGTETTRISESRFCPKCGTPLDYAFVQYGQLGSYACPECGWSRPELARSVSRVALTPKGYSFDATGKNEQVTHIDTSYNGLYMVYNVAAAFFAAQQLGAHAEQFQHVLDAYVPAGGRMASWDVAGRKVVSNLAKNPVGFDRQIQQIKTAGGTLAAFFLNDNDADGHDVSWIWDVDFERIADTPGLVAFAGGTRAHDMQVRLKYAGIEAQIIGSIAPALAAVAQKNIDEPFYAVANYTAFPALVKELEKLQAQGALTAEAAQGIEPFRALDKQLELERPLRVVYLYPDALNLYGDGGNAMIIKSRCAWRGIPVTVDEVTMGQELNLESADIVLMGGGADRDQLAVAHELASRREEIARYVESDGTLLAICGSYQLLGHSYYMGDTRIEGLGVLDIETTRGEGRLIGNVAVTTELCDDPLVGFENHGGRTHLGPNAAPLGDSVVPGTGNNGGDGHEGVLYRGVVGTYLHGPALSKNPQLADWLIEHALRRRIQQGDRTAASLLPLYPLDDSLEHAAHDAAMKLVEQRCS